MCSPLCLLNCDCGTECLAIQFLASSTTNYTCSTLSGAISEQCRQCAYNVTSWRVRVTIVAVSVQRCVLRVLLRYR